MSPYFILTDASSCAPLFLSRPKVDNIFQNLFSDTLKHIPENASENMFDSISVRSSYFKNIFSMKPRNTFKGVCLNNSTATANNDDAG